MIKVFMVDEYTWYAAETQAEALRAAMEDTGLTEEEYDDVSGPMSDEAMEKFMFINDNGQVEHSFRKELDAMIARGEKFPCMFAATEG